MYPTQVFKKDIIPKCTLLSISMSKNIDHIIFLNSHMCNNLTFSLSHVYNLIFSLLLSFQVFFIRTCFNLKT